MTERQISLVKNSWKFFRGMDPKMVGDVFYSRLFQQMPAAKAMFKNAMPAQYNKLVDMLSMIVARLDRLEQVEEEIRQLAIRHIAYGVRPAHYKIVGDALLWTLEKGLGSDWDAEMAEAWKNCYGLLSATMIAAASAAEK